MASALGYQCQVLVNTILCDSQGLLLITMSTSDCLPSNCTWEYSALDLPFATLNARGNPQIIAEYWLFPSGREKPNWQNFGTIPVVWCPQAFTVTFWHRSGAEQGQVFKLAVWEVAVYGTTTVSRQISSRSG